MAQFFKIEIETIFLDAFNAHCCFLGANPIQLVSKQGDFTIVQFLDCSAENAYSLGAWYGEMRVRVEAKALMIRLGMSDGEADQK